MGKDVDTIAFLIERAIKEKGSPASLTWSGLLVIQLIELTL